METIIHNYYELIVKDKNGKITNKAIAYNKANSELYMKYGYISRLYLSGCNRWKYIEPDEDTNTTYFFRYSLPYHSGSDYYAMYKAIVIFPPASSNSVSGFRLIDNLGNVFSDAPLTDIEGDSILLKYKEGETLTVNVYLIFKTTIPIPNPDLEERNKQKQPLIPIKYFQPSNSIFCGAGVSYHQKDLLKLAYRYNHKRGTINPETQEIYDDLDSAVRTYDGYLPFNVNRYIGFTKSPIPICNVDLNILYGGINDYFLLTENGLTKEGQTYRNIKVPDDLKGLITAIVFPGVGIIDLASNDAINGGPLREGILKGSLVKGQQYCYIPEQYIDYSKSSFSNNFVPWSLEKNAFYNVDEVIVRRYGTGGTKQGEIRLNETFFSDNITDDRLARCMSFSQHVPMTKYYCGAESLIPCAPSHFVGSDYYYGYEIYYQSAKEGGEEGHYIHNITASYIVLGEVVTQDYQGQKNVGIFPCKLECSDDGQTFETVVDTTQPGHGYSPYKKISFGTISKPVWKLSSTIPGLGCLKTKNTTFSDPYIADICCPIEGGQRSIVHCSGYDPMFIFVGNDDRDDGFSYPSSMEVQTEYYTKTPYLYHENDCIYFTGELGEGYRNPINTKPY